MGVIRGRGGGGGNEGGMDVSIGTDSHFRIGLVATRLYYQR